MARRIPEQELEAILAAVARRAGDVTARDIAEDLADEIPFRTLQYRIKSLVDDGLLIKEGEGRWVTYSVPWQRSDLPRKRASPPYPCPQPVQRYARISNSRPQPGNPSATTVLFSIPTDRTTLSTFRRPSDGISQTWASWRPLHNQPERSPSTF